MNRFAMLSLRSRLRRQVAARPEHRAPLAGSAETKLIGSHPRRVLVVGSGSAVGWGASSHDEALTGALARAFHEVDGRGVVVANRTSTLEPIRTTVRRFAAVGATSFDVVIWSPCLCDFLHAPDGGAYGAGLAGLVARVRETANPNVRILAGALPVPSGGGALEDLARRAFPRFNSRLAAAVARQGAATVAPGSPERLLDPASLSPGFYDEWAARIAAAALRPAVHAAASVR